MQKCVSLPLFIFIKYMAEIVKFNYRPRPIYKQTERTNTKTQLYFNNDFQVKHHAVTILLANIT